ncbi:MAG: Wzy polymerase domain-containing protein [Pseudomonadota bacterium]|nr:Wzy polymerase domain-containing protein [Pseudomonadota bacterium]
MLAASLSALIGLVQYFGLAAPFSPWISQNQAGEAFANLRQRNQFATLTSIGLVALLVWDALLEKPARLHEARRAPWWVSALAVLLALGNAASGSRTGLLQWGLIGLIAAWWFWPQRRQQRHLLALALQALLAYGVAVLVLPWLLALATGAHSGGLFGRLVTDTGCSSRKVLWSNVLTLIAQKPWLGWGWGELDYAHFVTLYPGARFCEILDNAHNLPLHLAVELGLPAAFALCGGAAWLVWRARPWRETDPVRQMAWSVLAVIGLHSLLEYPLWYGPFQIAAGLCVGLLWTNRGVGQVFDTNYRPSLRSPSPAAPYLRVLLAISLGAMVAGAAISYHQVSQIYLLPAQRSAVYRHDTLNKIRNNRLFRPQARFAELSLTGLTRSNAADVNAMAKELLHYSPEPRVIEKLIESAVMLGREDEALAYLIRYRAAFPADHARWAEENAAANAGVAQQIASSFLPDAEWFHER